MRKLAILLLVLEASFTGVSAGERIIRVGSILEAPVEQVWNAWTTEAGARSFFAPDCRIDLRVDGAYEMYFDPATEPGRRGGEGLRILVLEPMRRIAFTWNAPPHLPYVRGQRTVVTVEMRPLGPRRTDLQLTHSGWGEGPEWDAAHAYFERAWRRTVLPRLRYSLEHGPVRWSDPPALEPEGAPAAVVPASRAVSGA